MQSVGAYVDTSRFATKAPFQGVDLARQLMNYLQPSVEQDPELSTLRVHTSLGGVVSQPVADPEIFRRLAAEDPYSLVWFRFGWGRERERYAANAFRKLVPAAAALRDSFQLVLDPNYTFPNPVVSVDEQGRFPMGSFPHGGATLQRFGNLWLWGAVSSLEAEEDDAVAGAAARFTGSRLYILSGGRSPLGLLSAG